MAQHDYSIANQGFPATRADINNVLSAISTNNSGTSAPSTQFAGQFWIDTTSSTWTLYIHDGADDIQFATIDTSANTVNFIDSTINADLLNDTSPQLGGNLDLNSNDITGTGNINVTGSLTVDGGTIKLDGNYPVGTNNVALGNTALDDGSLSGGYNVAIGTSALTANTTGDFNTAVGYLSLFTNTTGDFNVGLGTYALSANTTANNNTAVGYLSLFENTTGACNTAVGYNSLKENTTGACNVAVGVFALDANTTANYSTGVGYGALSANTTASNNTAVGYLSLSANTTGDCNTALGTGTGSTVTTGSNLTLIGYNAEPSSATATNEITLGDANVTTVRMGNGDVVYPSAGGGITNAQQFRLTADLTGNNSTQYITANIEEADNTGYAGIGSIVSQSSGVFSFSATGLYQIIFTLAWNGQNTADAVPFYIDFTNDNSTYNTIAVGYTHGVYEWTSSITTLVNIDNTTNDKIKFKTIGLKTSSYAYGDTSQTETGFTFIRLGDSQ
jgi:hypothetical protein